MAVNQYGPLEKRLWERVIITPGCWFWTGKKSDRGYGHIRHQRRTLPAHCVVYRLYCGAVPEGKELDHLCRNRGCVNPDHLEPVTHAENVRRGEAGKYLSQRTHCKNGHPFDEANTIIRKRGGRGCRMCQRAKTKRHRHKDYAAYLAKQRKAYRERKKVS